MSPTTNAGEPAGFIGPVAPTFGAETASVETTAQKAREILAEVGRAVVGKDDVLQLVLTGLLANGHVLLEDFPGLAKTLTARSFAQVLGLGFSRAQFTPDLMPADITGSSVYDQRTGAFDFQAGPVFTNLLLADEVNRASPKTQAALLEAMQERQVTTDGVTRQLPKPFLVIATQNPIELEGTYPLPEAQLDRFVLRGSVGYPSAGAERDMLGRRAQRRSEEQSLANVVTREELSSMQACVEEVHVSQALLEYMVALVAATRQAQAVEIGASPRGSLALMMLSRARAAIGGRDYVVPEDVKAVAVPALAHRLRLRPDLWVRGERPEKVIEDCLSHVPVPPPEEGQPPIEVPQVRRSR